MSDIEKTPVNTGPAAEIEVGTADDVDAIMKKYDRESNVRIWEGKPKAILRILLSAFGFFLVWMNMFATWDERFRRPLFMGMIIIAFKLEVPSAGGGRGSGRHMQGIPLSL